MVDVGQEDSITSQFIYNISKLLPVSFSRRFSLLQASHPSGVVLSSSEIQRAQVCCLFIHLLNIFIYSFIPFFPKFSPLYFLWLDFQSYDWLIRSIFDQGY